MTDEDRQAIRAAVLDALYAPIPRLADQATARIVAIVDRASPPLAADQEQPRQAKDRGGQEEPEDHPRAAHPVRQPRRLAWPAGTRPRS